MDDAQEVKMVVQTKVLKGCVSCIASENGRYALNSVCFRFEGKTRIVESTDGKKLFRASWLDEVDVEPCHFLVPSSFIKTYVSRFALSHEKYNRNELTFKGTTCTMKLVNGINFSLQVTLDEGRFPKTDEVLPKESMGSIWIDPETFAIPLNALMKVGGRKDRTVKMSLPPRHGAIAMNLRTDDGISITTVAMPLTSDADKEDDLYSRLGLKTEKPAVVAEKKTARKKSA